MNKSKKRYQRINNNKNKKINNIDDGLNKEQNPYNILQSSTYTWQNYCKNSTWIYKLVNSATLITNTLFILLLTINGLSWKLIMEGSIVTFLKSYEWFFISINATTKDLVAFYYHPTTIYQMIPIIMGFIFSYIWDFFKLWLDLLTHGVVLVILLYKPLWRKKVINFYIFHGLCFCLTGDIWGFKLIDFTFSWRYTLINFCENILAGTINNDRDFLQWFKYNSLMKRKQQNTLDTCEIESMKSIAISIGDNDPFLTIDAFDSNNILFNFLSELINKYSRKFCVVGPISWVWIWILGLKVWYSSWIIENIKEIYIRFRGSIEKNIVSYVVHWKYIENDDTIEKPPPSPTVATTNTRFSKHPHIPLSRRLYQSSNNFASAKAFILYNHKIQTKKTKLSSDGISIKQKDLDSASKKSNTNNSNKKHSNKSKDSPSFSNKDNKTNNNNNNNNNNNSKNNKDNKIKDTKSNNKNNSSNNNNSNKNNCKINHNNIVNIKDTHITISPLTSNKNPDLLKKFLPKN